MFRKQTSLIIFVLFVFLLSSCSGFANQGDFNKALDALSKLESYKVTVKTEIISSNGVSRGESVISNTSFYKGIVEFKTYGTTNHYYIDKSNNVYEMTKFVDVHFPIDITSINFEREFGIVDFNKKYDVETEEEIVYAVGLLGIEKAQFKINGDGILYEIFEIKTSSVGSDKTKQIITYTELNKAQLAINFIEPKTYESMWINGIYKMGFEIVYRDNAFLIKRSKETVFEYRFVGGDLFVIQSNPYTYTYDFDTKIGVLSERITSGSKNYPFQNFINSKIFTMTDSKALTLEAVNEIIKFLNIIYGKNLKLWKYPWMQIS